MRCGWAKISRQLWGIGDMRWGILLSAIWLGIACLILWFLQDFKLDDAYISFSYARNFGRSGLLLHHPATPQLSTTAPLYAMILGTADIFFDLPVFGSILSGLSIGTTAIFLYLLADREWSGVVMGSLWVTAPLIWMTLGLETAFQLCLIVGAVLCYKRGWLTSSAVLIALATLVRADAILMGGIIFVDYLLTHKKLPLKPMGIAFLVVLPILGYLIWLFGSPIPATLDAKQVQAEYGITGFYGDTSFLGAAWVLVRAYVGLMPILLVGGVLSLVGLRVQRPIRGNPTDFLKPNRSEGSRKWTGLLALYGFLHFGAYVVLAVAPYYWYFVPVTLAIIVVVGWGANHKLFETIGRVLFVILFIAHGLVLREMVVGARGGELPEPTEAVSKILPEAKGDIYKEIGLWLNENTAETATVGVIEVGVMGYYADREMIDFLGLLQSDVTSAIERRDLTYALYHYLPDYLVLGEGRLLYDVWLGGDEWFLEMYQPVKTFEDERFWGSPLVVFERTRDSEEFGELIKIGVGFGGAVSAELTSITLPPASSHITKINYIHPPNINDGVTRFVLFVRDSDGQEFTVRSIDYDTTHFTYDLQNPIPLYFPIWIPADTPTGTYPANLRIIYPDGTDWIHPETLFELVISE